MSCESGIFIVYALVLIILNMSSYWLFTGVEIECGETGSESINAMLKKTLKNPHSTFFLFSVLFGGIIQGLYFNFLFVRLKELNAESIIFGLQTCVVVQLHTIFQVAS